MFCFHDPVLKTNFTFLGTNLVGEASLWWKWLFQVHVFFVESLGWDKLVAAKMWYPICELIAVWGSFAKWFPTNMTMEKKNYCLKIYALIEMYRNVMLIFHCHISFQGSTWSWTEPTIIFSNDLGGGFKHV